MDNGIKKVIITAWGDNGAEASVFSILPTMQLWAELCYNNNKEDNLKIRFNTCTSGDYDAFLKLDMPILTPNNPAPGKCGVNPSKWNYIFETQKSLCDILAIKTHVGINIRSAYKLMLMYFYQI